MLLELVLRVFRWARFANVANNAVLLDLQHYEHCGWDVTAGALALMDLRARVSVADVRVLGLRF